MLKIHVKALALSLCLLGILLPDTAAAQFTAGSGQIGFIESRVGWLADTSLSDGSQIVHMERLQYGWNRQFGSSTNLAFTLGGLARQTTREGELEILPEYQARASVSNIGRMELGLFSYSQLRNPMQILQDTLQHREQVHGIQLRTPIARDGRLNLAFGVRAFDRETAEFDHQFIKYQLEKKLVGLRFRLNGEQDLYSGVADERDRSLLALHWYGQPANGLNWTASNTLFQQNGNDYWRIYQRVNYQINERSQVWARISQGHSRYRSTDLLRRSYDINYRRAYSPRWGSDLIFEGNRVTPIEGDPIYHWRAYLTGAYWNLGSQSQHRGVLRAGYKESYRFGKGIDAILETHENFNLVNSRNMRLDLRDQAHGELFFRVDDADAEEKIRHDINHEVQLTATLWPNQRRQMGTSLRLINHFGSDLDFSVDTLRNAITHDVFYKWIRPRARFSVNHLIISEFGDDADTRLHLNTRASYRLNRGTSLNFMSMYRYQSDRYPEYLWLTGFLRIDLGRFDLSLDVDAAGEPDYVFENDLHVWMRVMRQL